jgi:predicted nucleotidyltransferase
MISDERKHEYRRIKHSVFTWSRGQPDIVGIAVVGPWARKAAGMDSHIDLLVLTTDKEHYVTTHSWIGHALSTPGEILRTTAWGPVAERQVRLPSGLIVEFAFAEPSWASTDPVAPGAARLVHEGCIPLADPKNIFERLIEVVTTGIW